MSDNPMGLDPLSPEAAAIRQLKDQCTCHRGIGKPPHDRNCPVHGDRPKTPTVDCTCLAGCPVHGHEMPFMITPDLAIKTVRRAILGDLMAEGERWRYEQAFERAEKALRALQGATPAATPSPAQIDTATDTVGAQADQSAVHLDLSQLARAMGRDLEQGYIDHLLVLLRALRLHIERDTGERHDVWRRSGLKGQVMHLFAKAERAFMALFKNGSIPDDDHMLDAINYAAFALRLKAEAGPQMEDGEWPWS